MLRVKTIDAHAGGEPLRLIVDGFPSPRGNTMLEKREWVRRQADHLRRALMLEPRGHADMYGAVLTEPVLPGSHAGVLFMHNEGYSTMCGHGIVAVTTIALERGCSCRAATVPRLSTTRRAERSARGQAAPSFDRLRMSEARSLA
jgi:trans-L-3-hydroxyproline dehydratase